MVFHSPTHCLITFITCCALYSFLFFRQLRFVIVLLGRDFAGCGADSFGDFAHKAVPN